MNDVGGLVGYNPVVSAPVMPVLMCGSSWQLWRRAGRRQLWGRAASAPVSGIRRLPVFHLVLVMILRHRLWWRGRDERCRHEDHGKLYFGHCRQRWRQSKLGLYQRNGLAHDRWRHDAAAPFLPCSRRCDFKRDRRAGGYHRSGPKRNEVDVLVASTSPGDSGNQQTLPMCN